MATETTSRTTTEQSTSTSGLSSKTPVDQHGQLRVQGSTIVNQYGEAVRLRGMSFFWSQWMGQFWTADTVRWLRDDWRVTVVRAAMGVELGGYLENPESSKAMVTTVVDAAIAAGIYVIIDWHDHNAEQHADSADAFFEEMARQYSGVPNVLFETFNEPIGQSWAQEIKPYHERMVSTIRRFSDNLIILGTPFYSQRVDEASSNPVSGSNLAYTIHFYAAASGHGSQLRSRVSTALSNGVALFATEWGTCQEWGDGNLDFEDAQTWLDLFATHHISDANWAVSDKDESCSALLPGAAISGWSAQQLTASGTWVRDSIRIDAGVVTQTPTTSQGSDGGTCSNSGDSCQESKCCVDTSLTCYEKNQYWAGCKSSCTPGSIDPTDPAQWQTPWTCAVLSP